MLINVNPRSAKIRKLPRVGKSEDLLTCHVDISRGWTELTWTTLRPSDGCALDDDFADVACRCDVALGFSMVEMETRGMLKIRS